MDAKYHRLYGLKWAKHVILMYAVNELIFNFDLFEMDLQ